MQPEIQTSDAAYKCCTNFVRKKLTFNGIPKDTKRKQERRLYKT